MAHENGFSMNIKSSCAPSPFNRNGHNFISLQNKSKYSVILTNKNRTQCDVELFIDQERMGKWRINPSSSITIERPSGINRQFMFVEENSADAWDGHVTPGAHINGLISAKFYPEKEYYNNAHQVDEVDDSNEFKSTMPHMKGFAFNEPIRFRQNSCYGAQCIRASAGSRGSVMNESLNMAPLTNSMSRTDNYNNNFKSGATVLNGRSKQNFGKVSPIKDIDTHLITKLTLRLVVEDDNTVYPLHSRPRIPEPPRIDRIGLFLDQMHYVNPLDDVFPQYGTINQPVRGRSSLIDTFGEWENNGKGGPWM